MQRPAGLVLARRCISTHERPTRKVPDVALVQAPCQSAELPPLFVGAEQEFAYPSSVAKVLARGRGL
jgi:hypothetical protein